MPSQGLRSRAAGSCRGPPGSFLTPRRKETARAEPSRPRSSREGSPESCFFPPFLPAPRDGKRQSRETRQTHPRYQSPALHPVPARPGRTTAPLPQYLTVRAGREPPAPLCGALRGSAPPALLRRGGRGGLRSSRYRPPAREGAAAAQGCAIGAGAIERPLRPARPSALRDGSWVWADAARSSLEVKRTYPGGAAERVNLPVPGAGLSPGRRAGSRPGAKGGSRRPVC
ncbi:hypothetical protein CIB84_007033 [Bambusicola thoracicus]|uniref:Uncharacterized protein n=1 Tax=Bambusicola thoracicus TaxID=9083 RepID=A0A2P4SYL9_BAMTH|nr:hypothetical protein CIB84_007033 [Bambusicola thoracicus]